LESPETKAKGSLAHKSRLEPHSEVVAQQKKSKKIAGGGLRRRHGEKKISDFFF
jgi:hypothetical protein